MMRHNTPALILSSLLLSGAAILSAQEPGSQPAEAMSEPPMEIFGTITQQVAATPQEEAAQAAESAEMQFRRLQSMHYDGITEAGLYPEVLATHRAISSALDMPELSDTDARRLRSMLLDLDPLLFKGAIYYSTTGDDAAMKLCAITAVDTRLRPGMASLPFTPQPQLWPELLYCAASTSYNNEEYDRAVPYFKQYLATGDTRYREAVAMFLGHTCVMLGRPQEAITDLIAATSQYPDNYNLLMVTLQSLLQAGDYDKMKPLMDRALLMRPDDGQLLTISGQLLEEEGDYNAALDLYNRLFELHPESLPVTRHLALCYYNLGAEYYNKALLENDDKAYKRLMRQSGAYFQTAADKLQAVITSDPADVKVLKALAMAYACLGKAPELEETNRRLAALGLPAVVSAGMPESVAYGDRQPTRGNAAKAPGFNEFASPLVQRRFADWAKRREFEELRDYDRRMNEQGYNEYRRLCDEAAGEYIAIYGGRLRLSDLTLHPYDVDDETYLITSDMGPVVVSVPKKKKEAEAFKASWPTMKFRNPRFIVKDDRVRIASVTLETSYGKSYPYSMENLATYRCPDVAVDFQSIIDRSKALEGNTAQGVTSVQQNTAVVRAKSSVDENIPVTKRVNEHTIAVVWANENYDGDVERVSGAINDGETFARYLHSTFGIPQEKVRLVTDATAGQMKRSMKWLRDMCDVARQAGEHYNVIIYYSGHGLPSGARSEAYLMPVDLDAASVELGVSLDELYKTAGSLGADNAVILLDACFTGATRDNTAIQKGKAMQLEPKRGVPSGNTVVFAAATGTETAWNYPQENHGTFTYFLLRKLQESKGNATLGELADYVRDNVEKTNMRLRSVRQSPNVNPSPSYDGDWRSLRLAK